MLTTYFGDLKSGTLARLSFLGHWIALGLVVLAVGLLIAVSIGAAEQLIGGDLQATQKMLRKTFSIPFFILFGVLIATVLFAQFNISAKRFRDMGLPGWIMIFAVIVLSVLISQLSQNLAQGFSGLVLLAQFLVPTAMFGRGGA